MKKKINLLVLVLFGLFVGSIVHGQKIFIDRFKEVAGIKLFRMVEDSSKYYYLPDQITISEDKDGHPQFSFIKYAINEKSNAQAEDNIDVDGGGVVHMLVEYGVDEIKLEQARAIIIQENENAQILGPVMYESGNVSIVSATAQSSGEDEYEILGLGSAPIMAGNKTAIAFMLNKRNAQLLWSSFDNRTSDLSVSFEMALSGFLSPLRGEIKGDFKKIYTSHEIGLDAKIPVYGVMLGLEVGALFENMRKDGIIEVSYEGDDKDFERFIQNAYGQLSKMLFERVPNFNVAVNQPGNQMKDKVEKMAEQYVKSQNAKNANRQNSNPNQNKAINTQNDTTGTSVDVSQNGNESGGNRSGSNPTANNTDGNNGGGFQMTPPQVTVSYKYKKSKQTGTFKINLNKISKTVKSMRFDENITSLKRSCRSCFIEVNLDDPQFKQREILAMVDGYSENDFIKYVNYATVTLRKKHQNGEMTTDEIRIDGKNFVENGNRFKLLYGYKGDKNRENWLEYDYLVSWNFFNDYKVEGKWKKARGNAIAISPPMKVLTLNFEADEDILLERGVRAIEVHVYTNAGEREVKQRLVMRRGKNLSETVEIILPQYLEMYDYEVIWMMKDGGVKNQIRKTTSNQLIYVDNL